MKKQILSAILCAAMVTGTFAGAGAVFADDAAADEGAVLNIQCWNEEFKTRLTDHYPGYEEVDATHGKIGDVDVVWTITPSTDNAYQNNLDTVLPENETADEPVDLFLVEADYALKYVNSELEVTEKIADLGITDEELANQYQYTKDVVTDGNGDLRGVSWQGCPGVLIYNRQAHRFHRKRYISCILQQRYHSVGN